jgi:hypothetical protein
VFQLLQKEQWRVKRPKCSFAKTEIAYLGYVISAAGVSTSPEKVKAVVDWPVPQNAKELRSFLGLASYYRKFVQHFGIISKPLTELLKKNTMFIWISDHDVAFQTLKTALVTAPVLTLPDFSLQFCIETDASDYGVGVVLMQNNHPIAYISKALGPKMRGLSIYEKEYVAILLAVEQWRSYLQCGEFIIATDQKSLSYLNEQRLHTSWQQKVFTKLLAMNYRIDYKKGVDNRVAHALSRKPSLVEHEMAQCSAISCPQPKWLEEIASAYDKDPYTKDVISILALDSSAVQDFVWHQGLLKFKNRIWVPDVPALQLKLVTAFHCSAVGGHSGVHVTYQKMKHMFVWKGMRSFIDQFIQGCQICQQVKPDRTKSPGLLQPLPVPVGAWQLVTMDFIEGLPTSGAANCIMVVVDKFTKYAHFLPFKHPYTAAVVANVFLDNVYKLHGMPSAIVSDRDKVFTSKLWKELFELAKVKLCMSSAYHPQSDASQRG